MVSTILERMDLKSGNIDIWLLELASGIFSRFTLGASGDPIWSPDGRQVVFDSNRKGKNDLFRKQVGGGDEELLFESDDNKYCEDLC